jgi:hypothetical protein
VHRMMHSKRLISWLLVAALSTTLLAAQKPTRHDTTAFSDEPFRSFRMLDGKLTLLTNQQDALKAAFNPVETRPGNTAALSRSRVQASSSMKVTAAEIERIAGRLERLYEGRHRTFGVQMFRIMRLKAREVQRGVNALAEPQTRSELDLATKTLDERIVSLVAQFQAASGGYGAVRCAPGAWTCCEPKRSKDLLQSEQVACVWGCVPRVKSCTGFVGPRISQQP